MTTTSSREVTTSRRWRYRSRNDGFDKRCKADRTVLLSRCFPKFHAPPLKEPLHVEVSDVNVSGLLARAKIGRNRLTRRRVRLHHNVEPAQESSFQQERSYIKCLSGPVPNRVELALGGRHCDHALRRGHEVIRPIAQKKQCSNPGLSRSFRWASCPIT